MTFNLSDKFTDSRDDSGYGYIAIEDVKEFIRLLKEELLSKSYSCGYCYDDNDNHEKIMEIIDKLAGDKLK